MRYFGLFTIIAAPFFLASCGDVVENSYADITEARNADLFVRGWLPDILPTSTTQIVTKNDLNLNISHGNFVIHPNDYQNFQAQLRECMKSSIDTDELLPNAKKGYRPFCYKHAGYVWVFYINGRTGHCKYRMKPTKEG